MLPFTKSVTKGGPNVSAKFGPLLHATLAVLLLLCAPNLAQAHAQELKFGGSSLGSIATGSGRIFRPARSVGAAVVEPVAMVEEEIPLDNEADPQLDQPMKRSMSLGRLAFRPGKRRFMPMTGAYAHDPLNRRYEFLFMDDHAEGANVSEEGLKGQPKLISHLRFRLLPGTIENDEGSNEGRYFLSGIAEVAMGKRSSLASGRIGFRPAKRSMAVGRTGFRPGKRSIATGRVRFRPGKRSYPQSIEDEDIPLIML